MFLTKKKIKDFFLYAGTTKNDYLNGLPSIDKENQNLMRVGTILATIIFFVLYIVSLIIKEGFPIYFLTMAIVSCVMSICMLFLKASSKVQKILMYLFCISIIAYGIHLGNIRKDATAVTYMVMLIVIPIAIADKPWRIISLIFVSIIGEVFALCISKYNTAFFATDLINTLAFGIVSIVIGSYISSVRVKYIINEKMLRKAAYMDSLTGLGNELAYLEEREEIERKIKLGENIEFCVAMFDVNCVKETNDTYGHMYGCQLIVETGHYLRTIFGKSKLFHIGGDEFVAIIKEDDIKQLSVIFDIFDKDMEEYYITKNGISIRLTCARGYTVYNPKKDKSFSDVLARADKLMYENKAFVKEMYDLASR